MDSLPVRFQFAFKANIKHSGSEVHKLRFSVFLFVFPVELN